MQRDRTLNESAPSRGDGEPLEALPTHDTETYRSLVEGIGDVLYAADEQGRLTYASPSVRNLLGYAPEEVVGRNVWELIHPDDLKRQAENMARLISGSSMSNVYRLLTRSGDVRWVRTSSQPIVAGGRIVGIRGMLADVTERKLAELRLEQQNRFLNNVLESLTHPFYVISTADYTVSMANSAAHLTGIADGSTCYALTHGRDTPCLGTEHPCPLEEIKQTGKPMTVEHIHQDATGNPRFVEVRSYPLFDANGQVVQVIEYLLDVTERKAAEQALQEAAVAAERSRLARDLHDSVTQALFSASLVAEVLPQVWQRDPGEAMQALEELRELTHGALAEMRAMLLELRPAALLESSLDVLIRQLAEAVTGRGEIALELDLEPAPTLRPDVQVTFYRVCQEALQNAIKHARPTHISVSLGMSPVDSVRRSDEWQGELLLEVADDGRGFDGRSSRPDQMGLRIMSERAESIGAHLAFKSRPGGGSRVTLAWRNSNIA
jgi:PAS domain S-box-containing protein